jgi:GNAT superfamily N-acetyltransferase
MANDRVACSTGSSLGLAKMRGGVHIVEDNLRVAMRFFGEATSAGEVHVTDGLEIVYSGLDYGVFNMALLARPVTSERDLVALLSTAGRFYHERKSRWSFWLCEDLLDPSARRHSREIFADAGMRVISHAPGMLASTLTAPSRRLPEIECRIVCDPESRAAFGGLTVSCFEIPVAIARAVYEPEAAWQGSYRGYVGMVNGVAVSIVALVRTCGALGVYSLGTLPAQRHKGYGEALLRAAIAKEDADNAAARIDTPTAGIDAAGSAPLVLESTEAGYRLYRRIGFRDVTNFTVYLSR